jgi:hypothetical protein
MAIIKKLLSFLPLVQSKPINLTICNEIENNMEWTSLAVSPCLVGLEKETILH